jgi:uncharacterized protein YjgD (DUF1641 family)
MDANDALELERVTAAARDALTDEMVSRLSATAADGIDLLDQINRSGVGKALPALAQLVANGDLDRLVALARTYGAAQDAMTDEMVSRMAETMGASLSLMDRLNRAGVDRLVGMLERLASSGALERLDALADRLGAGLNLLERVVGAIDAAGREMSTGPAAGGGLGGIWQLLRERENQETLRFLFALGRSLRGQSGGR